MFAVVLSQGRAPIGYLLSAAVIGAAFFASLIVAWRFRSVWLNSVAFCVSYFGMRAADAHFQPALWSAWLQGLFLGFSVTMLLITILRPQLRHFCRIPCQRNA